MPVVINKLDAFVVVMLVSVMVGLFRLVLAGILVFLSMLVGVILLL